MLTAISKWGNSQGIELPMTLLGEANLSTVNRVEVVAEGNRIIIRGLSAVKPQKTHLRLQERFENFTGTYSQTEINWGKPEGEEVW
jgi:antitoxin MazE